MAATISLTLMAPKIPRWSWAGNSAIFGRMVPLPKPEVIITHESDLDGLLSGVLLRRLARKLFDVDVPLEAHHYHSWRQRRSEEHTSELQSPDHIVCRLLL